VVRKVLAAAIFIAVVAAWYASVLTEPSIDFNHDVIDDALEDVPTPSWYYDNKLGTDLA